MGCREKERVPSAGWTYCSCEGDEGTPQLQGFTVTGIGVLSNASYKNPDSSIAVTKVKGIEAILAAMKRYPLDENVQHSGLWCLRHLISTNEANANVLIMKLDGVPMIIETMSSFAESAEIARVACKLLKNLCRFEKLKKAIFSAKAATALASAIDKHQDHDEIQKFGREAIKLLL